MVSVNHGIHPWYLKGRRKLNKKIIAQLAFTIYNHSSVFTIVIYGIQSLYLKYNESA